MIDYVDVTHTYLNSDGIIIPSVSKLTQFATNDDYSKIPPSILKQAQDFGTAIHNAIELYLTSGIATKFDNTMSNLAFSEFLRVYRQEIRGDIECEFLIDYDERYAGRVDCRSGTTLIDFKTNTKINIPHLEWQLSFYAMALESKGVKINKLMCLWLPKRKSAEWIEIKRIPNKTLLEVLKRYEDSRQD